MKNQSEIEAMEDLGVVPDAHDVLKGNNLRVFCSKAQERIDIVNTIKELEEQKKQLDDDIMELMVNHNTSKVLYQGRPVSIVTGSRSSLSKEKLLEAGVPAKTIVECTSYSNYDYLLIGKEKK
jgi:hypothetical protein